MSTEAYNYTVNYGCDSLACVHILALTLIELAEAQLSCAEDKLPGYVRGSTLPLLLLPRIYGYLYSS